MSDSPLALHHEATLRALVDAATDSIVSADAVGNLILANRAAERMFGYSALELIGRPITLLMPDRFHASHLDGFRRFLSTGESRLIGRTVELVGRKKDGVEFPIELSLASWKASEDTFFTAILRDITERKQIEERLRLSEYRTRALVDQVRDYAILMLDPQGRVESWNAGAELIKGYRAEEVLGKPIDLFYLPGDRAQGRPRRLLEAAAAHGTVHDEGWRVRKDGSTFWADVTITALRDAQGTLTGFAKITRDATRRYKAEEESRRRSAELDGVNRELETFSYSVAHDLRGPLRAISGFSSLLEQTVGPRLDDEERILFERIRSATGRMGQLIDDLLALARVSRGELRLEEVDLSALAEEVAADLRKSGPERPVDIVIAKGLSARGDAGLLRVALENLLGNAWKFTSRHPRARIEVGSTTHDGARAFFVRDDGAGFDLEHAQGLFSPFQRFHGPEEFAGTGIGLATVQRIVLRHGGRVWAESGVERGATFYFTLAW